MTVSVYYRDEVSDDEEIWTVAGVDHKRVVVYESSHISQQVKLQDGSWRSHTDIDAANLVHSLAWLLE